jgi:outer membrane receptor for ferrienterochelin and colicin
MRIILSILILLFSNFLFSQDQLRENPDNYIYKIISDLEKEKQVTDNPVIVINEKVFKEKDWINLSLSKFDIESISIINKDQKGLIEVYGQQSVNGVILIKTKPFDEKIKEENKEDSNVLFLIDGKKISNSKVNKIDPESIEKVEVIKNQDSIKKYTSKEVQGIIKIILKKA